MRPLRFLLREEHVALLRRAVVRWEDCEYGAPAIDCKRPYGNSGVESDVAEILKWDVAVCPHCGEPTNENWSKRAAKLHAETETALQVILAAGSFEPGEYMCDEYMRNWRRVPEDARKLS